MFMVISGECLKTAKGLRNFQSKEACRRTQPGVSGWLWAAFPSRKALDTQGAGIWPPES